MLLLNTHAGSLSGGKNSFLDQEQKVKAINVTKGEFYLWHTKPFKRAAGQHKDRIKINSDN
jgi:hypothetical protein